MEAEVIEKLECEVDSSLMKLNKDQLIEIAAGISLDKKYYEDKSKLTVLKNIRKYIDGQEDTLKYELLSKLPKVLDTEYSIILNLQLKSRRKWLANRHRVFYY